MTLNYRVIVERYPFPNIVAGGSISVVKCSLYWTEIEKGKNKLARYVGSQEPTHHEVDNKPHHAPRGFLTGVEPTGSHSRQIADDGNLFVFSYFSLIPDWENFASPPKVSTTTTTLAGQRVRCVRKEVNSLAA